MLLVILYKEIYQQMNKYNLKVLFTFNNYWKNVANNKTY